MPFTLFEGVLGGVGLFLFGIRLMSDGIRTVADTRIRTLFATINRNRLFSFSTGFVLTLLVQSGGAAVVFVFALLHNRILSSFQALNILAGVLAGASVALQIHIPSYNLIAPFLIFSGILFNLFARQRRLFNIGTLLLGVGILYLGLSLLDASCRSIAHHPLYEAFDGFFYQSPFSASMFGLLLSFLVQSATAFMTTVSSLMAVYTIPVERAMYMVAAGVSGAALLGCVAVSGLGAVSRRLAFVFLFTTVGSGLIALLIWLYFFNPVYVSSVNLSTYGYHLARLHFWVSCIAAGTLLLCSSLISRFMVLFEKKILTNSDVASHSNGYLDKRILKTPTIALEQARKEVVRMMTVTSFMCADLRAILQDYDSRRAETIKQHEHLLDSLNHEIAAFLARLSQSGQSEVHYEIALLLHTVSGLEHIGDRCEEILVTVQSKKEAGVIFSDAAMSDIQTLAQVASDVLLMVEESVVNGVCYDKDRLFFAKKNARTIFDDVKKGHFIRVSDGICSTRAMMYFNDITAAFMRIIEDCWAIIEDRARNQL